MIIEFFKYLTNPATQSAKKMGQLQETIAMEARYKRSKKQWASHLENSKAIIKSSTLNIKQDREIIILGSGLLLDIPIEYLAEKFKHIYLVDVVHLKKVKQITRQYKNVSFIEHDVTGLADLMLNASTNQTDFFDFSPTPQIPCLSPETGLIVSANMLSQIHLAPIYFAEKNLNFDNKQLEKLAYDIMSSHISLLANASCQVCLLTDNKRLFKDNKGNVIDGENILFDIELPRPDKSWYWEIAPKGELEKNISMISQVYAYENFILD